MRKNIYALGLVLGLSLLTTGCNTDKEATATPAPTKQVQSRQPEATTDTVPSNDAQPTKDVSVTKDTQSGKETKAPEKEVDITLAQAYEKITSEVEFEPMFEAPEEYVENCFGLIPSNFSDSIFYISESELSAETLVIVKVTSSDEAASVTEILDGYVESKKAELEDYMPEAFVVVEKAKLATVDSYVYLIISNNVDAAEKSIKELL